jgi:hypothetical protein
VRPLLDRLGRATFHVGALGLGNVAKLINSLMAFSATWISLEGLAVAAKAGIDIRMMIDVIRTGGAGNIFTDRMVEGINERGRPTQFSLALAAKDAGLLLEVAREHGCRHPPPRRSRRRSSPRSAPVWASAISQTSSSSSNGWRASSCASRRPPSHDPTTCNDVRKNMRTSSLDFQPSAKGFP